MAVNFWKGRPVLVTGGAGFVGFWLASVLAKKRARVFVLSTRAKPKITVLERDYSSSITFIRGTVTSQKTISKIVKENKIVTIFHLAGQAIAKKSYEGPPSALDANSRGTWHALEAASCIQTVNQVFVASPQNAYV